MGSAPSVHNAFALASSGSPPDEAADEVREKRMAEPRYGRLSVLVVDGDALSRIGLQQAVQQLGHECRTAKDGIEAWQMLQADRADVVLSDWSLPRMGGRPGVLPIARRIPSRSRLWVSASERPCG